MIIYNEADWGVKDYESLFGVDLFTIKWQAMNIVYLTYFFQTHSNLVKNMQYI